MARIISTVIVALVVGALAAGGAVAASPRVVPGWPKSVGGGTVLAGPGGGVVVVSIGIGDPSTTEFPFIVSAYRRTGRRLWSDRRVPGCGNCDDGRQPELLQADGTYGPIGFEGDDFWAVDPTGQEVLGCSGAVAADGTCFFVHSSYPSPSPAIVARTAAGALLWSVTDAGYRWMPALDEPPVVGRDGAGLIYAAFGQGTDVATGATQPGRLIAVDPVTRAILWSRTGQFEVLTALGTGMLAARAAGLVALGPDGSVLWSRPLPVAQTVAPVGTVYDAARDRLYIRRSGGGSPGVTALVAGTGAQVWRTRPSDRARLLSVGPGGRVYLAIDAPARRAVRAVRFADGRVVWQRRTRLPVRGARELANGMVAVSAGANPFSTTPADRLTLLDPRG